MICRNTLMYFNAETQAKILARFHFALRETAYLFLGKAEMLLSHTDTAIPVNLKLRIFRKIPRVSLRNRLLSMANTKGGDMNFFNLDIGLPVEHLMKPMRAGLVGDGAHQ